VNLRRFVAASRAGAIATACPLYARSPPCASPPTTPPPDPLPNKFRLLHTARPPLPARKPARKFNRQDFSKTTQYVYRTRRPPKIKLLDCRRPFNRQPPSPSRPSTKNRFFIGSETAASNPPPLGSPQLRDATVNRQYFKKGNQRTTHSTASKSRRRSSPRRQHVWPRPSPIHSSGPPHAPTAPTTSSMPTGTKSGINRCQLCRRTPHPRIGPGQVPLPRQHPGTFFRGVQFQGVPSSTTDRHLPLPAEHRTLPSLPTLATATPSRKASAFLGPQTPPSEA